MLSPHWFPQSWQTSHGWWKQTTKNMFTNGKWMLKTDLYEKYIITFFGKCQSRQITCFDVNVLKGKIQPTWMCLFATLFFSWQICNAVATWVASNTCIINAKQPKKTCFRWGSFWRVILCIICNNVCNQILACFVNCCRFAFTTAVKKIAPFRNSLFYHCIPLSCKLFFRFRL